MIKVENLTKSFDDFKVLNNINISVKKGSIYGLIGANGSGKTTLIKHIMGILKQDSGTITVNGHGVYENNSTKTSIGYIPDEFYYFSGYTIKQMKAFYGKTYTNWNNERYETLKDIFKIDENKKIGRLSKGMQKQVAFWLTLSTMPVVMVLDEPIDGLDPLMRKRIWNLMMTDVAERNISILISSHNLKELESVCDTIGILHKGEVLIEKELDDLKSDVHKIQVAFKEDISDDLLNSEAILYHEKIGTIYHMIIKGNHETIIKHFNQYHPLLLDLLPLTLEEIFIYELGGVGYEIKDIIF